jgi:branched-chain amino acid transport system substrate-binding protein
MSQSLNNLIKQLLVIAFLFTTEISIAQVSFADGIVPLDGVVVAKPNTTSSDNSVLVDEKITVKIGHVAPLSGAIAHLGRDNENGALLAIEDLNRRFLRIGKKVANFVLISEDDAANPRQAVEAANRLVKQGAVAVVGHLNSGASIPASKIYSDAGIPQISPSSTNPKFTRQGLTNVFRLIADDASLGQALGRIAVKKYGVKKVLVIDDRTAYGAGIADAFEAGLISVGGIISKRDYVNDKTVDFSFVANLVISLKPDLIFFGGMDSGAGPLIKQINSQGQFVKVMGGDGICTNELSKLAGNTILENQVFCAESGGLDAITGAIFNSKFKTRFNSDVQIYAPYVYDSVMVIADAIIRSNSINPELIKKTISSVSYNGVTGLIEVDSKGDLKNPSISLFGFRKTGRFLEGVYKPNSL